MIRRLVPFAIAALCSCTGKYIRPTSSDQIAATPERLDRGRYLVDSVAACGACHTTWAENSSLGGERADAYLAGGNYIDVPDDGFGVWVPNLTPDAETGLGKWTDDQIIRAIRDGVHADGHLLLPFMPFGSYQYLSDEDVRAVVAYLRSVPPVKQPRPRVENKTPAMMGFLLRRGVAHHEPVQGISTPKPTERLAYGRYLAQAALCPSCHALGDRGMRADDDPEFMSGSLNPLQKGLGKIWASNLTPDRETGVGEFSAEQLKEAITSGSRLDGARMGPPMAQLSAHYKTMKADDLDAIVAWLQSLKPVRREVPERELNAEGKAKLE